MTKKALITGVTGQDGSYLSELLLEKGYEVHGIVRRTSTSNIERVAHLSTALRLHYGDVTEVSRLMLLLQQIQPDEVYHLASQSDVRASFDQPEFTGEVTGMGTTRILEAIRLVDLDCRVYQASSSEMFGASLPPQNESTPFWPRSPYAAAKTYAYWVARNYREAHGMFVANGIMFNHESPRRGMTFVTRKITHAVARIKAGYDRKLYLGNLDAVRDWGYAKEYVEAMWLMLQADKPSDYVVATGTAYTVRDFAEHAFGYVGLDWREFVRFDDRYLRPTEVDSLIGDPSKTAAELGWKSKVLMPELASLMVEEDLRIVNAQRAE
ncbi:GDP-mannose 4,6-dehydratase [Streptomyces antimycoticus]|uniref:GDP-mannose 4,6-dehydratase n=1 Tax=Streptomyces antimycoticus TaxID=68175 RepID=UPI0036D01210